MGHDPSAEIVGDEMPEELAPHHLGARVLQLVALAALTVAAISALPGLSDVRARFANADPALVVLAGVLDWPRACRTCWLSAACSARR